MAAYFGWRDLREVRQILPVPPRREPFAPPHDYTRRMSPAWYKFLADAVIVFHFAFVGFVLLGGLLVLRWRRVMWVHLPCVAWGIWIELSHGLCPLTPLENDLRELAGGSTYEGGFVDHYIMPILYPVGLTHET